jgi:DNA replication initiation complex subunit (GINS family)
MAFYISFLKIFIKKEESLVFGMVEVNITYETLFDLLRRERSRNELQELEKTFYDDVKTYLNEKEAMLKSEDKKFTSRAEQEKIKIQIKNARKIIKELYETREKKILHLAESKVKSDGLLMKTSSLLDKEKDLFDETVTLLKKYKLDILSKIVDLEQDYAESRLRLESKAETSQDISFEEKAKQKSQSDEIKITLNTSLPKFVGLDQKIYGPFNKGETTSLPSGVANLLISKGRAQAN